MSDIGTLLDRKIAAAMAAGSSGPLGDAMKRLNTMHDALKVQRASGLLTEEQYAKEAGGLLNLATWATVQRLATFRPVERIRIRPRRRW